MYEALDMLLPRRTSWPSTLNTVKNCLRIITPSYESLTCACSAPCFTSSLDTFLHVNISIHMWFFAPLISYRNQYVYQSIGEHIHTHRYIRRWFCAESCGPLYQAQGCSDAPCSASQTFFVELPGHLSGLYKVSWWRWLMTGWVVIKILVITNKH